MTIIRFGNHMAPKKDNNDSPKKQIIEFDMFVRDLEPEPDETIRGGGKGANQYKPDDRKRTGPLHSQRFLQIALDSVWRNSERAKHRRLTN